MNTLLFETELTDGSRWQKYRPILYLSGITCYAIAILYDTFIDAGQNESSESVYMPYIIITIFLLIIWAALYFYIKKNCTR